MTTKSPNAFARCLLALSTGTDENGIVWMEWLNNKHNVVTAHAVNPKAEIKNDIFRAINGSVVPDYAVPANSDTPRDPFCMKILATAGSDITARATKAPKKAKLLNSLGTTKREERLTDADFIRATKPVLPPMRELRLIIIGAEIYVVFVDGDTEHTLGKFAKAKLGDARAELRLSTTHWGVYQDKKRVSFGKLPAVLPVNLALPQTCNPFTGHG